ncbi:hypothetical protein RJ639_003747 [Escallonia herrerae]|uniref:C2H2-type domain-containing protein n=1 Tax=Escallonia herrerae TaxID=1293975 RepID=A0AA88WAH4_9ASTE|nr:hypothetical protein RJ639_003747 [Escallonia herrerae]
MAKPKTRSNSRQPTKQVHQKENHHHQKKEQKPASWTVLRSLFTCKNIQAQQQQHARPKLQKQDQNVVETSKKCKKMMCSGSLCNNSKIMQRPELSSPISQRKRAPMGAITKNGSYSSSRSMMVPVSKSITAPVSSSSSPSIFVSSRVMPFTKLAGCYECRMVVDPVFGFTRDPSLRATICSCPQCGEIFMKAEYLELHQSVKHAESIFEASKEDADQVLFVSFLLPWFKFTVSELGAEDTSKNIVEIIFQSSWLRKESPVCKIDRILKVQNTPKTISRFEEYRDTIRCKAAKLQKKHPRCVADGNELLRFHSTTFTCSLGLNGSSNLCNSIPRCKVCSIIKSGFKVNGENAGGVAGKGILTTATSGKAHDSSGVAPEDDRRAMLVCRVIAGRVKKSLEGGLGDYDSMAGVCSNLDELYVLNPKAIMPCFVVIYRGF